MTLRPSSDESAKRILNVFKECSLGEGSLLMPVIFIEPFRHAPWTKIDFQAGLNNALSKGWIKVESEMLRLTQWGAEEIA